MLKSTQVLVSKHANEQCVGNALTCTRCYSSNFSLGLIISKINNNFILQFYSLTIAFCFVYISAASLTPGYPLAGHLVSLSDAHKPLSSGLKCSVSHALHKRKHFYLSRQLQTPQADSNKPLGGNVMVGEASHQCRDGQIWSHFLPVSTTTGRS